MGLCSDMGASISLLFRAVRARALARRRMPLHMPEAAAAVEVRRAEIAGGGGAENYCPRQTRDIFYEVGC